MSTANKLTYLNVTKQKLKQAINNIGGEVTDETTFRQYVAELENAYDRLPKTEFEEGESVTLENTLKGKLDYDNGVVGIGQIEQDGTPTPDTPIEIKSVTGTIEEVVSGKNLWGGFSNSHSVNSSGVDFVANTSGTINVNGTATANAYSINTSTAVSKSIVKILEKGTYTISGATSSIYLQAISTSASVLGETSSSSLSFTITLDETTTIYIRAFVPNGNTITNVTIYPQLEQSSTATTYEPYITPTSYQLSLGDIELCGIGNYKDELIYDVGNDKVYKKANIKEINSNSFHYGTGIEVGGNFSNFSTNGNIALAWQINDLKLSSVRNDIMSDHFTAQSNSMWNGVLAGIQTYANGIKILISVSLNDVQTYAGTTLTVNNYIDYTIAYLNSLNAEIFYILATPTQTEITDTTLINQVKALYNAQSNNGTTIITSNGDLPMIIKVRGLKGE